MTIHNSLPQPTTIHNNLCHHTAIQNNQEKYKINIVLRWGGISILDSVLRLLSIKFVALDSSCLIKNLGGRDIF